MDYQSRGLRSNRSAGNYYFVHFPPFVLQRVISTADTRKKHLFNCSWVPIRSYAQLSADHYRQGIGSWVVLMSRVLHTAFYIFDSRRLNVPPLNSISISSMETEALCIGKCAWARLPSFGASVQCVIVDSARFQLQWAPMMDIPARRRPMGSVYVGAFHPLAHPSLPDFVSIWTCRVRISIKVRI